MNQVKKSSSRHPKSIASPMRKSRKIGDDFGKRPTHGKSKEDRLYLKAGSRPPALKPAIILFHPFVSFFDRF